MADAVIVKHEQPITPYGLLEYFDRSARDICFDLWVRWVNNELRSHVFQLAKSGSLLIYEASGDPRQHEEWQYASEDIILIFARIGWEIEVVELSELSPTMQKSVTWPCYRFSLPGKLIGAGNGQ